MTKRQTVRPCSECGGSGVYIDHKGNKHTCPRCGGSGKE